MKNVNIMGVHQFLGELGGGRVKKNYDMGNCLKRSLGNLQKAWQKIRRSVPEGAELKIGLVYVSTLNFDQSFLQFNAKKKNKCEEIFTI